MERWSLGNYFRNISHKQFQNLVGEFQAAAEQCFSTPCSVKIELLNRLQLTCSSPGIGGETPGRDRGNRDAVFFKTSDVQKVTPDLWRQARQVIVTISPVDEASAPPFASGTVKFKGKLPSRATFYLRGGRSCITAKHYMHAQHPIMRLGDGRAHHGEHHDFGD